MAAAQLRTFSAREVAPESHCRIDKKMGITIPSAGRGSEPESSVAEYPKVGRGVCPTGYRERATQARMPIAYSVSPFAGEPAERGGRGEPACLRRA